MSLSKVKAQTQSRLTEQKKIVQRKRNIVVLVQKYLLSMGYIDAVSKIQQQSHISLQNWDTADNIDLYMIILEFEQFYQMKFGKFPKLVKKAQNNQMYEQMKKAALKQKQINSTINKQGKIQNKAENTSSMPPKPNFKKKQGKDSDKTEKSQKGSQSIEIQGNSVNKKKEQQQEFFDVRITKGVPDYSDVPQYRDLAAYLQRDICIQNPNVKFDDIVGLDDAKRLLKEAVMLPLKYPFLFTGILQPWRGVLLFGPPGTGKTMLAKAVATQCKTTFFNISASSVVSKWRGQSEKLIRVLFQMARHYQPSTIFLDELDSIMSQRTGSDTQHQGSRRMKTQLLIQMDGLMKNRQRVFLLAASNMPWDLDVAMLRRLQKRILVPLPCTQAREAMVRMYLPEQMATELDYKFVSKKTQNYSGSDIKLLCKQAAMKPLRRLLYQLQNIDTKQVNHNKKKIYISKQKQQNIKPGPVTNEDIQQALKTTKSSPGMNTQKYLKWVQNYGSL